MWSSELGMLYVMFIEMMKQYPTYYTHRVAESSLSLFFTEKWT